MEAPNQNLYNWEGLTILIGEDELVNFRLLEMILSKTNAKLLHGRNGREVVQLFKDTPNVSMILMDIKMPVMDGLEAVKEIRLLDSRVPIIAQTAYAIEDEKDKCLEAGCNSYITKPINRKELLEKISSLLLV